MSEPASSTRRVSEACRRVAARTRPAHAAALVAVGVAAFGLLGLRAVELPGPAPVNDGERLRIEVVAPIEPRVSPGPVMEVGELVDGFTHVPAPPAPEPMDVAWAPYDAWAETVLPPPPPRRRVREISTDDLPPPPPPEAARPERGGGWFGFDAPRRDYAAEREARRARLEALAARERQREQSRRMRREIEPEMNRAPPPPRGPVGYWD